MEEDSAQEKEVGLMDKFRENPWVLSTFVLGVLSLILILGSFGVTGNITGGVISENQAGDAVLNFIKSQGVSADLVGVETEGSFYEATVLFQGQEIPLYVTRDGKYLVQGLTPLAVPGAESDTSEVPKSNKPKVELFIWSYCPYGVQAQGPMAEVVSLLGDYADFSSILYYDGHGAYETQQNKIQACVQKIAPEKYWAYAEGFVEEIYPVCGASGDINCDREKSISLMTSLGIDAPKIMSCVSSEGEDLIDADSSYAQQLGVTGSPTIIINGVKANVARDAESIKNAVCGAFNDAPEVCAVALSSSSATASGNC